MIFKYGAMNADETCQIAHTTRCCLAFLSFVALLTTSSALVAQTINHHQSEGIVVVEAEHFASQHKDNKRRWMIFSKDSPEHTYADSDLPHYHDASGGQYIEILPDTRSNHFEELVREENFSNVPGKVAILSYPVYFESPGTYFVWARAYSSGSEDNGVHFGINGTWPQSGQRLQLCEGKHQWTWSSAQRIKTNHCGTPNTVTLTVPSPGVHNVMVSMREDGFELDKFILTTDKQFVPQGAGESSSLSYQPDFPKKSILLRIKKYSRIFYAASDFGASPLGKIPLFPLEKQEALAIDTSVKANHQRFAYAQTQIDRRDAGKRSLTLVALALKHHTSKYKVLLNDKEIGKFASAKTDTDLQEQYFEINNIHLNKGDVLTVASMADIDANLNAAESSPVGGLWRALVLSRE